MPSEYTPNAVKSATITEVADGDPHSAASLNVSTHDLADNIAWLMAFTGAAEVATFTASGTWTSPVTGSVVLIGCGGGGGGARGKDGGDVDDQYPLGGGGGGGAIMSTRLVQVTKDFVYDVTIGAGGAGGGIGQGSHGGDTVLLNTGSPLATFRGASGGYSPGAFAVASLDQYNPGGMAVRPERSGQTGGGDLGVRSTLPGMHPQQGGAGGSTKAGGPPAVDGAASPQGFAGGQGGTGGALGGSSARGGGGGGGGGAGAFGVGAAGGIGGDAEGGIIIGERTGLATAGTAAAASTGAGGGGGGAGGAGTGGGRAGSGYSGGAGGSGRLIVAWVK